MQHSGLSGGDLLAVVDSESMLASANTRGLK